LRYRRYRLKVGGMQTREPIHVGSGEPIVMLHPFLCSQNVWRTVADQLADTGRFEVFAPTMVGHHGGNRASTWFMDTLMTSAYGIRVPL